MMSYALSSSRRYAFGLVEGVDWICTHDASASTAFRGGKNPPQRCLTHTATGNGRPVLDTATYRGFESHRGKRPRAAKNARDFTEGTFIRKGLREMMSISKSRLSRESLITTITREKGIQKSIDE